MCLAFPLLLASLPWPSSLAHFTYLFPFDPRTCTHAPPPPLLKANLFSSPFSSISLIALHITFFLSLAFNKLVLKFWNFCLPSYFACSVCPPLLLAPYLCVSFPPSLFSNIHSSLSLAIYLPLPLPHSLPLFPSLSLCVSVSLSKSVCLSMSLSLYLSLPLSIYLSIYISISFSLSHSFTLSIYR